MESDDLIHWTRPRMTMHRDGLDETACCPESTQMYEHVTFPYESMWIGLPRVMYGHKGKIPKPPIRHHRPGWKQVELQLSASRDGRHWTRVCRGQVFLPLGKSDKTYGVCAWDADILIPCRPGKPLLIDNELWFYYWGSLRAPRFRALGWPNPRYEMHIGLAKLRRDGFVSLDAGKKAGAVVTRPLTFEGGKLCVNAEIAAGGYLKVELRDASGKAVKPYTLAGCKPVTGDVLNAPVVWTGRRTIQNPSGKSLRLAFEMKKAKLYSFWIE